MKKIVFLLILGVIATCGLVTAPNICVAQSAPDTLQRRVSGADTLKQGQTATHVAQTNAEDEAVTDTVADSAALAKAKPFQPNPKKAGLYSALVPGMGQLYNRQYWKLPIVYVGLGVAAYFIYTNYTSYQDYRTAYIGRINNPYPTDKYVAIYSTDQLNQLQNDYSKYLDLTALLSVIGYAVQVLDAVTSAHLKNFDISRDISMRFRPVAMPNGIGFGLVISERPKIRGLNFAP